jgi:hypothetical protein
MLEYEKIISVGVRNYTIIKRILRFLSLAVRYINLLYHIHFSSYSLGVPFHQPPGLSPMTLLSSVVCHNNNMEDFVSQTLQLKTNVNRLQDHQMSLFAMD